MSTNSLLVFTGIAPHPPIMVPEVGGDAIAEVRSSIEGMAELTRRLIASRAQTVVVISPHAPLETDSFVAYEGPTLYGDFSRFHAPETQFTVPVDEDVLKAISANAAKENFQVTKIWEPALDHGTAVPLHFLIDNGWKGKVVALGYCFLSNDDHLRFGTCVRRAIDESGRRAAFIASGDLSHRLKLEAPAGYNPGAYVFDEEVVDAIRAGTPERIPEIDHNLRKLAGECGYRSMLVAIGATKELPADCELISYEAPFGVGYLVAQLTGKREQKDEALELTSLARMAVETYVKSGNVPESQSEAQGLLAARAPCFVSLKTLDGELRGCIGTIESTRATLAEELIANAVSAAIHDPRFPPVTVDELTNLSYSVDVLLPAEPTMLEDLNPKVYGVIVEDESGEHRGLLLPDIPGVEDPNQQVEIATRKAGIAPGVPVRLSRFKVERFRE
ncbi:MAG TPA: AmmeMemoRadiSam system protein A [Pyrinomonadaceae bacterium]|nr:AmmeMemoRadiSam system protein A [Pyrinomonadaceae bacterium]